MRVPRREVDGDLVCDTCDGIGWVKPSRRRGERAAPFAPCAGCNNPYDRLMPNQRHPTKVTPMDNFHIDITSQGDITPAMKIAFENRHTSGAVAYLVHPEKGLIFFWSAADDAAAKLPFKLDAVGAADFATRWLAEQDYGRKPDHDGDNERGWRLYNESWGMVDGFTYAFVAVRPAWAMYGK